MDCLEGYGCCPPLDCLFTSHRQRKKKEHSGPLIMNETSDEDDSGEGEESDGSDESNESNESKQDASGESDEESEIKILKGAKLHRNQEGIRMHASMLTNLVHLPLTA